MPKDVVLFRQQVPHRMAGRDVGQEPERVLQIGQHAHIRIGKRWPRTRLQMLGRFGRIAPTDDVQPLLHIALMLELRGFARAGRGEKLVEVKLVKLAAARNGQKFVRHLIRQQPHLRQRTVGVPLTRIRFGEHFLGALLVGVRPVENLLLDELPRGQRLERRAGEIQVSPCGDGQKLGLLLREHAQVLVHVPQVCRVLKGGLLLGNHLLLALEQLFCGLAPRAEMVLVKHHKVPIHRVQPLVLGLDVPRRVAAEQVLKRTEIDHRLLGVDLCRIAAGGFRQVLPPIKINMRFKVALPGILDCGLERQHEHPLGLQLLRQLVGGEGLAKAHLRVPQKTRNGILVFGPDRVVVVGSLGYGIKLLAAHRKGFVMRTREYLAGAQLGEHGLNLLDRATHPLQLDVLETLPHERRAHIVIAEQGAVVALCGFVQLYAIVLDSGRLHLLRDALLHIARGLPHLEQTLVRRVINRVGVDAWAGFRLGCEDFLDGFAH